MNELEQIIQYIPMCLMRLVIGNWSGGWTPKYCRAADEIVVALLNVLFVICAKKTGDGNR